MNLTSAVEAARPDVGPMPVDARRHVRERLFDVAHVPAPQPPTTGTVSVRGQSVRRRLAVLALLVVAGGGVLALNASRSSDDDGLAGLNTILQESTVVTEVIEAIPPPTPAPTTTESPVVGSSDAPLLMPVGRVPLDALRHTARPRGQTAALLQAPDDSLIGLLETDGLAPTAPTTTDPDEEVDTEVPVVPPWERVGTVRARRIISDDPDQRHYEVELPCGTLVVADGTRFGQNRQQVRDLLTSMSIEDGVVDIALPDGWQVVSNGPFSGRFEIGLPIDANGGASPFRLVQYPASELAIAAFGGMQFSPIDFLGEQAWIGRDLDDPSDVTIVGSFGETAFSIRVTGLSVAQIETEMLKLEAGSIDDWVERFGALDEPAGPDYRTCVDQPELSIS